MMPKRLLLLRHAPRPPSCLLYRHDDVCRSTPNNKWLMNNRVGQRRFASLASNNSSDDDYSKSHQSASTATSPSTSTDNNIISSTLKNSGSSNANPNEVHKFSSFATHWWDSRSNPLVGMNPIRIKFIREVVDNFQPPLTSNTQQPQEQAISLLPPPLHNKRILDIGCGGGLLTESLSRLGANLVVGLDASTHVVDVARTHSFHEYSRLVTSNNIGEEKKKSGTSAGGGYCGIQYIGGMTVEEFASTWTTTKTTTADQQTTPSSIDNPHLQQQQQQNNELFDIITALEIIEHVPNPSSLLYAAQTLLKPNGILFVSTINRTVKSYGMAIVAAEYILGKVPVGTHSWDMFWSPDEVEHMILGGGSTTGTNQHYHREEGDRATIMKQIALSGMVLQPPFINMEWTLDRNDTDVNWIGAYQKQQV